MKEEKVCRALTYLHVRNGNLLHRRSVIVLLSSKTVLKDDVRQPKHDAETNTNNSEPATPLRPALDAARTRAREEAVAVLVVAITRAAQRAVVAFRNVAQHDQSAE